jgi:hypothetical protein
LALVASAASDGVLRHECLRADADSSSSSSSSSSSAPLPTAPSRVAALVQRTFLQPPLHGPGLAGRGGLDAARSGSGFGGGVAAAAGVFADAAAAARWSAAVSSAWPCGAALEARLEAACVALTADLPRGHPLRVRPCPLSPLAAAAAAQAGGGAAPAGLAHGGLPLALPALLAESAGRRAAYLERRTHPGVGAAPLAHSTWGAVPSAPRAV